MKNRSPIFVLFVTIFIDLLGFGLIIPILPIFALELQATSLQIGVIAGIYSLMNFVFAPFWGTLSDKIGSTRNAYQYFYYHVGLCLFCIYQ